MSGDGPAPSAPEGDDPSPPGPPDAWDHAARAQLALLLEVSGTPKPGNVDRSRDHADLRFEQFLAGAVGARPGLALAADGDQPLGRAFERAVAGMGRQRGGNTQFGALLVLAPLVRAAAVAGDPPAPATATAAVEATTVEDCVAFYEAFEHVAVAVDEPPEELAALDVRRGADAAPAVRERQLTWGDLMARSADSDGVAAEWTDGFPRVFDAADRIGNGAGSVARRGARAYLAALAAEPDGFVAANHGDAVAAAVCERAAEVRAAADGDISDPVVEQFAERLVARSINPGTTADVVAGGLYVAIERGVVP